MYINEVGGPFRASIHGGDQMGKTWQNLVAAQGTMCVFHWGNEGNHGMG